MFYGQFSIFKKIFYFDTKIQKFCNFHYWFVGFGSSMGWSRLTSIPCQVGVITFPHLAFSQGWTRRLTSINRQKISKIALSSFSFPNFKQLTGLITPPHLLKYSLTMGHYWQKSPKIRLFDFDHMILKGMRKIFFVSTPNINCASKIPQVLSFRWKLIRSKVPATKWGVSQVSNYFRINLVA